MLDLTYQFVFLIASSMFIVFVAVICFKFIKGLFKAALKHKHKFENYKDFDSVGAKSDLDHQIGLLLGALDRSEADMYYKFCISNIVDLYNYKRYLLKAGGDPAAEIDK